MTVAEAIGDLRALSYASGYLGTLSEDEKQLRGSPEVDAHVRIFAAQQVHAPESLYLWQWQAARLLTVIRKEEDGISAYRNCIYTLQSIRQEMSNCYGRPRDMISRDRRPSLFGFVDLLPSACRFSGEPGTDMSPYLMEARETVEPLKVAELRDYFQDECMGAQGHDDAA